MIWQQITPDNAFTLRAGTDFVPFSAASLTACSDALGHRVTTSDAQNALDALRAKNLVWRAARGSYAIAGRALGDWREKRENPPTDAQPIDLDLCMFAAPPAMRLDFWRAIGLGFRRVRRRDHLPHHAPFVRRRS